MTMPDTSHILIVDDDPDLLNLVSSMIASLGYTPDSAGDAMDAFYYLNKTHYDLVLTDYHMPSMNGYQLADQIKRRNAGTKVIIMTGHFEKAIINVLLASDTVDGLLLKPFNLATLKEKIEILNRL